ncbi:hypothetical protein GE061_018569 [Apolygus lucorum]|uniref:Uncharacterized protein n=1 Tax=Apolygus lucorum TaxID=248454 RepID=A0A8S9XGB8_APOLU|nr:hypothetical protein GE061_018569 [Apolygus lucorum]
MVDKKLYNCILSQVFSPCGSLLVCGSIYGDIGVFDLNGAVDIENSEKGPQHVFSSPNSEQICSLASTQR